MSAELRDAFDRWATSDNRPLVVPAPWVSGRSLRLAEIVRGLRDDHTALPVDIAGALHLPSAVTYAGAAFLLWWAREARGGPGVRSYPAAAFLLAGLDEEVRLSLRSYPEVPPADRCARTTTRLTMGSTGGHPMRSTTLVSEVSVLERHGPVVARMPRAVEIGDAAFELEATGRPHRLVGRVEATRFEGRWRSGRRSGAWRLDALPAGPYGTLVSVVIEGWRGRGGEDLAFRVAQRLRDRIERPLVGRGLEPADPPVPTVPVWETAEA